MGWRRFVGLPAGKGEHGRLRYLMLTLGLSLLEENLPTMLFTDLSDFDWLGSDAVPLPSWTMEVFKRDVDVGVLSTDLRGLRGDSEALGAGLGAGDLGIRVDV